jgi:Rod binding domain-containing protein
MRAGPLIGGIGRRGLRLERGFPADVLGYSGSVARGQNVTDTLPLQVQTPIPSRPATTPRDFLRAQSNYTLSGTKSSGLREILERQLSNTQNALSGNNSAENSANKIPLADHLTADRWRQINNVTRLMRAYVSSSKELTATRKNFLDNQLAINLLRLAYPDSEERANVLTMAKEDNPDFQSSEFTLNDFKQLVKLNKIDLGFLCQATDSSHTIPHFVKETLLKLVRVNKTTKWQPGAEQHLEPATINQFNLYLDSVHESPDFVPLDFSQSKQTWFKDKALRNQLDSILADPLSIIYRQNKTIDRLLSEYEQHRNVYSIQEKPTKLEEFGSGTGVLLRDVSSTEEATKKPNIISRAISKLTSLKSSKAKLSQASLDFLYKLKNDSNFATERSEVLPAGGTIISVDLKRSTFAAKYNLRQVQSLSFAVVDLLTRDILRSLPNNLRDKITIIRSPDGDGLFFHFPGEPSQEALAQILNTIQLNNAANLRFRESCIRTGEVGISVRKNKETGEIYIENASVIDKLLKSNDPRMQSLKTLLKAPSAISEVQPLQQNNFLRIQPSSNNRIVYSLMIVHKNSDLKELQEVHEKIREIAGGESSHVLSHKSIIRDSEGRMIDRESLQELFSSDINLPKLSGKYSFVELALDHKVIIKQPDGSYQEVINPVYEQIKEFLSSNSNIVTFAGSTADYVTAYNTKIGFEGSLDKAFPNSKTVKEWFASGITDEGSKVEQVISKPGAVENQSFIQAIRERMKNALDDGSKQSETT